jgi:hypothetical protein
VAKPLISACLPKKKLDVFFPARKARDEPRPESRARVSQEETAPPKQETRGQRHHGFPRRNLFCSKEAQRGNHYMYSTNTIVCTCLIREEECQKQEDVRIVDMMFFWLNSNNNNLFVDTLNFIANQNP